MSRAATLVPVLLLLAACGEPQPQSCPGTAAATFAFSGSRVAAGDPALAGGLDPVPLVTDCAAAVGFPGAVAFGGTLASDGSAGSLCRTAGPVLFGTRTGDRWKVEAGSDGAVLGGCDPKCAASSHVVVTGDVVPDAVTPAGFQGAFVEELVRTGGSCGGCVLPCATRYVLAGTVEAP